MSYEGGTYIYHFLRATDNVKNAPLDKPSLWYLGDYTLADDHNYNFTDDVSFGFGVPVLGGETCFQDGVNRRPDIYFIESAFRGHTDVLLLSMKESAERGCTRGSIR